MKLAAVILCLGALTGLAAAEETAKIQIVLNLDKPAKSRGLLVEGDRVVPFEVGYGKHGVLKSGARFKGGYSLLGAFRVNAILADERFEMAPALIQSSGKEEAYLRKQLFANMSAIDFDGDGKGGEYGDAFIGLQPLSDTKQPFAFAPYKGVFRWYSYAIHGTQDESRIGKKITGGCINVGRENLQQLLKFVEVGDLVEISASAGTERD